MQKRAKDANQLTPLLKASIMLNHTLYLVPFSIKRDRRILEDAGVDRKWTEGIV